MTRPTGIRSNPTPLAPDHPGDESEPYGRGHRTQDEAFRAAMTGAIARGKEHAPLGTKLADPSDCKVVARPFAGAQVFTASMIDRL